MSERRRRSAARAGAIAAAVAIAAVAVVALGIGLVELRLRGAGFKLRYPVPGLDPMGIVWIGLFNVLAICAVGALAALGAVAFNRRGSRLLQLCTATVLAAAGVIAAIWHFDDGKRWLSTAIVTLGALAVLAVLVGITDNPVRRWIHIRRTAIERVAWTMVVVLTVGLVAIQEYVAAFVPLLLALVVKGLIRLTLKEGSVVRALLFCATVSGIAWLVGMLMDPRCDRLLDHLRGHPRRTPGRYRASHHGLPLVRTYRGRGRDGVRRDAGPGRRL